MLDKMISMHKIKNSIIIRSQFKQLLMVYLK